MVVCTAAVCRSPEPYCYSYRERVTAKLLIGQMRLRAVEGEKQKTKEKEEKRERHCVPCIIQYVAVGPMYAGVHICSVCVCRADF